MAVERKPTVENLGIDLDKVTWVPPTGGGTIVISFVEALGERWVLMRVAGDLENRVSVYNRHEWDCFLDGAKAGEFDDPL